MSPQEFHAKMRDIFQAFDHDVSKWKYDPEGAHSEADALMCDLLRQLGYGAGVDIFEKADKWYA